MVSAIYFRLTAGLEAVYSAVMPDVAAITVNNGLTAVMVIYGSFDQLLQALCLLCVVTCSTHIHTLWFLMFPWIRKWDPEVFWKTLKITATEIGDVTLRGSFWLRCLVVLLSQSICNWHCVKLISAVLPGITRNAKATRWPGAAVGGCCLQHAHLI